MYFWSLRQGINEYVADMAIGHITQIYTLRILYRINAVYLHIVSDV